MVAMFALTGIAAATTGAPAKASTQWQTINVNQPVPTTVTLKVGEHLQVITDNDAPGGAAILGASCLLQAGTPALMKLSWSKGGEQQFAGSHPGTCKLEITFSHYPSDPKFTKHSTTVVTVTP